MLLRHCRWCGRGLSVDSTLKSVRVSACADLQDIQVDRTAAVSQRRAGIRAASTGRPERRLSAVQPRHAADGRRPLRILSGQSFLRRKHRLPAVSRLHCSRHSACLQVVEQPAAGRGHLQQLHFGDW